MTESGDKQSRFRRSLEGIGDILVFETKRKGKNQVVMDGLKKLQSTLEDFFNLQESDPDRFNELMLAPDFLELQRTDPREAGARLLFLPEKQFVSLTVALTQIRRVHETAIDVKNEEISRQATYHLIWILDHLTKRPGNDIFIRQLLRNLWQVTELAIESNDPSVHSGALTWYFHTVFRTKVDLSYLALLTEHFRQFVQDVISNDRWELFTSIVSSLHTSVLLPINQINKLWDYEHHWVPFERTQELDREHNIRRRLQALMQSAGDVDSVEEYEAWLKDLAQVDAILDPHVSPENREQKNKVLEEIKEFVAASLKFNALREAIFALAAFALMERRPRYIKYLWEYRQPEDSDVNWVGTDPMPTDLPTLVSFYFRKGYFGREILVWKDRHGSRIYLQRYFLLLLARALQRVVESNGRYPELDAFSLPRFDVHQLSNVESSTDDLSKLIPSIKNDTEMLQALGFPENKTAEIFDRKLPALLNGLKEKTRVGIKEILRATPISQEKVGEFREQARSGFEREAIFRRILQFYGLVQDKTAEPLGPNTPETWGIVQVDDKAAFFADWYSSYSGLGEGYGQGLAQSENNFIIKSLFDRASSNLGTLDQVLGSFTDPAQALIFAGHMTVFHNFEQGNNNFTSKWMKGADPIELDGFEGWYQWYGHKIPVFVCHLDEGKVIIVDRLNVGTLIQYDPTRQGDRPADRTGILSVSVRALSHEPDLLNEFLEKPPTWLQEIGDKNAQEAHLKEKVLIRVLERFEFRIVAEPAITLIDSLVPEE